MLEVVEVAQIILEAKELAVQAEVETVVAEQMTEFLERPILVAVAGVAELTPHLELLALAAPASSLSNTQSKHGRKNLPTLRN
jgi:hypothetical protein